MGLPLENVLAKTNRNAYFVSPTSKNAPDSDVPQLPLVRTSYTDSEMFWIVKHGIRNTAMPAWGNLLSDEEIWQVVTLLRKFDSLPDP